MVEYSGNISTKEIQNHRIVWVGRNH